MSGHQLKRLSLLIFCCLIRTDAAKPSHNHDGNVYSPVIHSICNNSEESDRCVKCLKEVINRKVISLTEIGDDVTDKLMTCLEDASEDFKAFQCELYKKPLYKLEDYLGNGCIQSLQNKSLFLNLDVNLSDIKSNLGYYNLAEVIVTTLMGILKHAKDTKLITSVKSQASKDTEMCSLMNHSRFLSSLSQAAGKSWTSDFENRERLFFKAINERVCKGAKDDCFQCLQEILNNETIIPEETSGKNFLKLLKCKSMVPNKVFSYLSSIKEKYSLDAQLSTSCLHYLEWNVEGFKFGKNLNITDLIKDTFYIQEIIKFGIGTVFYYLNDTARRVPDDMRLGICQTVIFKYAKTFKYAMESLNIQYGYSDDTSMRSKTPYMKMFALVCADNNVYCKSCYQKILYSVDVLRPSKISETVTKVLTHCREYQSDEFKHFQPTASFKSCMNSNGSFDDFFIGYPINEIANYWTSATRPNFSEYIKFLNFVYKGICYYYKDDYEPNKNAHDKKNRVRGYYGDFILSTKLRETGLPGAYLYVIPGMNKRSIRGKSNCEAPLHY